MWSGVSQVRSLQPQGSRAGRQGVGGEQVPCEAGRAAERKPMVVPAERQAPESSPRENQQGGQCTGARGPRRGCVSWQGGWHTAGKL